ncbi:MAG: tetratricopeptide repeat protein [Gracilimonas sp.]|jgi:signal transduction histidine kinase|nr:tetratricopeptide repeat protein [Gracilimonas sp.]
MGTFTVRSFSLLCSVFIIVFCAKAGFAQTEYDHHIQYIDSVNSLSFQYVTTNPAEAQVSLNKAYSLADSLNYKKGMAKALMQLSWSSSYLGNWDESVEQMIRSIQLHEELGMHLQAGYGLAELSWGVRRRSHERAEYFMGQAFNILKKYPQSTELSNAYNNYGIIKLEQGQIDSAIYFIEKSMDIKESNNDTLGIAYSYGYLGTAYQEMGNYETAIRYLEDSYNLKTLMNDSSGMAIDLTNIAANYQLQGDYSKAAEYFRRSVQMALDIKYQHLAEHNYNSLATLFEETARYDSALHYHKLFFDVREARIDESTNQRLAELEVQFETEQKEKEIALNRAEIASSQLKIRNRNWILSALGGILLFGGIITAMVIRQQKIKAREQKLKLQLAKSETQNKIHKERERISRDLHDNVGAQITSLISGLEISNMYVKNSKTDKALDLLKTLDSNARDAMGELRETIWLLNKDHIPVGDFIHHIKNYVAKHNDTYGDLDIHIQNNITRAHRLDAQQSLHMLRIIQESLANCVKYANASNFNIQFDQHEDQVIIMKLSDDGKSDGSTTPDSILNGNGMLNMKRRVKEINGQLHIDPDHQNGFSIKVEVPISANSLESA